MGKRPVVVLSSSDDDDFASKSTFNKPKSRTASRANPKGSKKVRVSSSRSHPGKKVNPFEEMKLFCEDFGESFTGFKVSAGYRNGSKELWLDKYTPSSLAELCVHKKKVEEVKVWFEERISTKKDEHCNHVLLITGPSGVGKSATVYAVASHLGATVCEWNTPTPTIWQEHIHTTNAGLRYMSKLDEFENFVEKIRKYGLISSSSKGEQQKPYIILIDDLPVINGKISYGRLQRCLHLLVQSVRIPTVILITDYTREDTSDYTSRCWEDLQTFLQSAGACKVTFNPITVNSMAKTLSKICRVEKVRVTADQIDVIAKASGGDIRHAVTSMQYLCLKSGSIEKGPHKIDYLEDGCSLPFGRDETLSLFHALGKFLHNKRDTENSTASDADSLLIKEDFARLPMKMDAPERVLGQAHGQARPIADFLQENVLDFVHEEAMDDAWMATSYLSDADTLLASLSGAQYRNYVAENIIQSTAASVAVRGVMFGNRHPLSARWHAIRRPTLWQVDQSLWRNKKEMVGQRSVAYNGVNLSDVSIIATEWNPFLKWLGPRAFDDDKGSISGQMVHNEGYDGMEIDDDDNDDEIEDW
ncbi:putative checkpoint protein Rad17/Rad24 [Helianthus annuus]|uniref:Checkpoint protein Rad17/Rad24 n=1 Tax=Helianthus annuus TaxID=4232 RepID=A0A251SA19_HELAN|nr:cell cycle checkpoint protein RAD17 isoform X1 [Helianthus annuus]KAF5765169.1 putative checkpoint protein Rad17/Rad24 [Helianthus annuus]KAJ0451734.1 putative checkpoint protein Rad17/Rad24 [Helianthus annuus]KAJ0473620.1 putative checkpoint protein Rad17/Rad24 [Helianthus annuus]KAJ0649197.1 putative checkpoint protein Rad17/Rad24 [Helianthus annuus]KAJ0652999.1 putative checkpoint protein Rad17/Rad24 [Helianthus annuus]